jgi:hypothetical protein
MSYNKACTVPINNFIKKQSFIYVFRSLPVVSLGFCYESPLFVLLADSLSNKRFPAVGRAVFAMAGVEKIVWISGVVAERSSKGGKRAFKGWKW